MLGVLPFVTLGYAFEYLEKRAVFDLAKAKSVELHKPLLNAGCGWYFQAAIDNSDINMDVAHRDVPRFVLASIEQIPFPDKYFGAVFCSHVVEHVDDYEAAMLELERVSDYQYIIVPKPIWLSNWLNPDHKRIFIGDRIYDKASRVLI